MSKSSHRTGGPRGLRTTETLAPGKVKMKFKEDKFYNDRHTPIFKAGEVYELEGEAWIQRWIKRGGEIVKDARPVPVHTPDPSVVIPNPKSGAPVGDKEPETKETNPTQGKAPAPKLGVKDEEKPEDKE